MKTTYFINMIRNCLLVLLLAISVKINAIEVQDLYVAKVEVTSQSSRERNSALKKALAGVFIKVGGQNQVLDNPVFKTAIKQYKKYYSKYSYQRKAGKSYLVATFDESKINQLFIDANESMWGSLRPQIVVWVVDENGLSRQLLSGVNNDLIQEQLFEFSEQRGLPVLMPLMDLTDVSQVATSDVWGRFAQPVIEASKRYFAETIVIIRVSNSSLVPDELAKDELCTLCKSPVVVDWSLISDIDNVYSMKSSQLYQGFDLKELLTTVLGDITDEVYQEYAVSTDENNEYIIDVANINSFYSYLALSDFLQQLSTVRSVQLLSAKGDSRRFKLTLLGTEKSLLSSLKLNKQLVLQFDPLAPVDKEAIPVFMWGGV